VEDVNFGLTILFGVWIFFITARPLHKNHSSQPQQPLPSLAVSESESWSFEPESSDQSAIEQGDHWVMG
jgi:hypothetical protein